MNQLFYNIAGGIVHQIRREKRTMSEVIVLSSVSEIFKGLGHAILGNVV